MNSAGYSTPNSSDLFKIPLFVSEHKDRMLYPFEIDELSNVIKVRHSSLINMCCPEYCLQLQCGRTVQGKMRFLNLTSQMFISSISRERCKKPIEPRAKKSNERIEMCDQDEVYTMTFNMPDLTREFEMSTYTICLHKNSKELPRVRHTFHTLRKEFFNMPSLDGIEIQSDWSYDDEIYSINPNQFYRLEAQKKIVSRECANAASKWFKYDDDETRYFIRSQHVPEADHAKIPQKRLTFDIMNAAPQWQPFTIGQWKHLEDSIRSFINDTDIPLDIITGNWGNVRCQGTNSQIYLNRGASASLTIPKLFYKIIKKQDESHDERIFIAMVNDPSVTDVQNNADYHLCRGHDICNDLRWFKDSGFTCNSNDQETGYTYVCIYDENLSWKLRDIE